MLAYQWHAEQGIPVVFLHGLLGSQADWRAVIESLNADPQKNADYYSLGSQLRCRWQANVQNASVLSPPPLSLRPLTLDLPCHGKSLALACESLDDAARLLDESLTQLCGDQPFYLVGYSLGGRIALHYQLTYANPALKGCLLEGVNLGLSQASERNARWQNDQKWAERFRRELLAEVLAAWYQQPVFASLTEAERAAYCLERLATNQGERVALMLCATSLAKQPDYAHKVQPLPNRFVIGEKDHKFRQLAEQYQLSYQLIPQAGHNSHHENPEAFSQALRQFIAENAV